MQAVAQLIDARGAPISRLQDVAPSKAPTPAGAEAAAIIAMVERAASNPDVDIEKMQRLLDMREREMARASRQAYAAAFAEMQPELPVITEKGRIEVKHKDTKEMIQSTGFARWEDINEAIRPVLAAHGFGLSFRTGLAADGKITVTGILSHREGHQEETVMTLPHDSSGSKNAVQAVGSSTSYGKRYTAMALLNITSRGEDDDGVKAGVPGTITQSDADDLRAKAQEVGADMPRFLAFLKVERLEDIPVAQLTKAWGALETKARAR